MVAVVHRALDVAVLAAVVEAVSELQGDHVSEVAAALDRSFVDIAAEEFRLVGKRVTAEGVLGKEGETENGGWTVGHSGISGRSLMTAVFTFHKVPTVVGVCAHMGHYPKPEQSRETGTLPPLQG